MVRPSPEPDPRGGHPPGGRPPRTAVGTAAADPPPEGPLRPGRLVIGWHRILRDLLSGNAAWATGERAASGRVWLQVLLRAALLLSPLLGGLAWLARAALPPWLRYPLISLLSLTVALALGAILLAVVRAPRRRPAGFVRRGRIGPRAA